MNKIVEEIDRLKVRVERDLYIDEGTLRSKVLEVPKLYHFYLKEFTTRSLELKLAKGKLEKVFGERVKFYKEEYDRELKMSEIERYVFTEDQYYNLHVDIVHLEALCKYLEEVLKRVGNLQFDIKNYIDLRKFMDGN